MDTAETANPAPGLAWRLAGLLGAVEGVVAAVLGGSWARGEARPDSDLDIGIYYHPNRVPSIEALRNIARRMDDRQAADAVTDFGAWGPWVNGGAWLQIEGQKVDWLFRDLARVMESIEASREGRVAIHYQPGHPFGFPSYLYMGEISHCLPLHDPQGEIAMLKALTVPYPSALKRAITDTFLGEAGFALQTARSAADRGDISYVAGCLFRSVGCLVQVLFAINERYLINEKGAVAGVDRLALQVPGFRATVEQILGHPGRNPEDLRSSLARLEEMVTAVGALAAAREERTPSPSPSPAER